MCIRDRLRTLPPGVYDLGRFEYIQSVVDLQPLEKFAKDVPMLTTEGIPVKADIGLTFRIDPGDSPVTHNLSLIHISEPTRPY